MLTWNEAAWFSFFIGVALKSTAVLGVAWMSAFLLRGRSAAARHLVWTAAAAAVIALPLLSLGLPALPVPTAVAAWPSVLFHATVSASPESRPTEDAALAAANPAPKPAPWRPDWRVWLMLLWAAGAAAAFAQMLAACAAMWRVRLSARPVADRDFQSALSRQLGIRHPVDVLETATGSMPMTFGLVRSAVFLPSDAAGWSEERRRIVLLHELAHVRRGDVATHLLARTALAMYWWNPLAWMAWRQFLKERERATDDLVLNAGARASDYAGHLLEVARTLHAAPATGCAAIAMARPSQLEGRLLAILDSRVDRRSTSRLAAAMAAVLALGVVVPLAAMEAQDNPVQVQPDVDATIRAAMSQKNHEMLESAASAFEKQRQFDTAQKLLESAVAIRGEVSGQQSQEYGLGLVKLADLEERRGNRDSAVEFYTKAAGVLGESPQASHALIHLGLAALVKGDFDQAAVHFQHAQSVDPSAAGQALMWLAVVNVRQKKFDQAETFFKSSLALEDPTSHQAAITMKLYADLLKLQGRTDESKDMVSASNAAQHSSQSRILVKPAANSGVYRVGGSVTAPSVLSKADPEYSEEARAARYQGTVLVSVQIGPDGLAHNAEILQSLGLGLDEKAIAAISQWRFKPGTKDGQPVTVAATIEVNFRLL